VSIHFAKISSVAGDTIYLENLVSDDSHYRVVPGSRNWHVETALGFWPVSCTIFGNLLAGIWGSFLKFIETGFRNWLAAFLGFSYDFSMMSMIFQDFFIIFL